MHRQTIDSYDAGADRWRATRCAEPSASPVVPAASAFRRAVGEGLILDLGCGPGAALLALGEPVVGIDASLAMLALVETGRAAAPLVAGDIEELPLADSCAAGAFGSFSFQHLPRSQFLDALREVRRVLRPGGLIELWMHGSAGVDGVRDNDDMGIGRWFTYWNREDLDVAVTRAGFVILSIEDHPIGRQTLARRTDS